MLQHPLETSVSYEICAVAQTEDRNGSEKVNISDPPPIYYVSVYHVIKVCLKKLLCFVGFVVQQGFGKSTVDAEAQPTNCETKRRDFDNFEDLVVDPLTKSCLNDVQRR